MRHVAAGLLALALAACQRDTAIVVEVTWTRTVDPANDTLRIYVGQEVGGELVRSDSAFAEESFGNLASPYRHELQPSGDLDAIGDLRVVAAITREADDKPLDFGEYPAPVRFGDGEIRTVPVDLVPRNDFVEGGDGLRCIAWDLAAQPQAIGDPADADCDEVGNDTDCAPYDPHLASFLGDPEICDGTDQACDGATVAGLPCLPDSQRCFPGILPCGEAGGNPGYGSCLAVSELPPFDPLVCARLHNLDNCLDEPDPLACLRDGGDRPFGRCAIGARKDDPSCSVPQRVPRPLPLPAVIDGCLFEVFGGTHHAEWEVGFVSDATAGQPVPQTTDCDAALAVRALHDRATPRTIMVTASYGLEPGLREQATFFVTLDQAPPCAPAFCSGVTPFGVN